MKAYLSDRKHVVVEDSVNDVTSGVPQRSILGLLLFVIYVNGLPEVFKNTFFLLVQ